MFVTKCRHKTCSQYNVGTFVYFRGMIVWTMYLHDDIVTLGSIVVKYPLRNQ
jgi:hypothetical protein